MLSLTGDKSPMDIVFVNMVAKEWQGYKQIRWVLRLTSAISTQSVLLYELIIAILGNERTYQQTSRIQNLLTPRIFVRLLRPSFSSLRVYSLWLSVVL